MSSSGGPASFLTTAVSAAPMSGASDRPAPRSSKACSRVSAMIQIPAIASPLTDHAALAQRIDKTGNPGGIGREFLPRSLQA